MRRMTTPDRRLRLPLRLEPCIPNIEPDGEEGEDRYKNDMSK